MDLYIIPCKYYDSYCKLKLYLKLVDKLVGEIKILEDRINLNPIIMYTLRYNKREILSTMIGSKR